MEKQVRLDWQEMDAVIFDLGGVILNLHYENTIEAFTALSGKDAAQLYTQHRQDPAFDDLETGRIGADVFRDKMREIFEINVPDEAIDAAWNALLLDIPKERIEWLKSVKKRKRTFLLSNTNVIHKAAFDEILQKEHGLATLDGLFEKAYYSHLMGDRKPHPSIFQQVIDEQGLFAEKTLFIDDTAQHLEGAKKTGLHTFHMVAPYSILDLRF